MIVLLLAGLTIIGYASAVIVEAISGGVFSGALAERRRERTIEQLGDHFIICGYGRVGRRVGPAGPPIDGGDVLIGVGSPNEIQALEDLFAPPEAVAG